MDTDGIDKVISFLCLCDSFNIPLIFFHDIPGFLVGKAAERKRVAARVMNYMNALGLLTVPRISIIEVAGGKWQVADSRSPVADSR